MDVVIGLDSGTTATKAVTAGTDGVVRALASVGYPLVLPGPRRVELAPRRLCDAAVEALRQVAGQAREQGDAPVAVCLSAAMHGLVPLDPAGSPTGPLLTWADGRASEQARRLHGEHRAAGLHARTGTPVHSMAPLAKLAWWLQDDPHLVAATPRWGGVKELIVAALCDTDFVLDLAGASATGMYDIHRRVWDPEALEVAGVRKDQLPRVVPTTEIVGGLRSQVADATGLPRDLPVVIGASDGVLANLGVGAVTEGVAAVSLGTSGALRAVRSGPAVDASGRLFCYALTEDRWVLGGSVNNAGSVVRWAARTLATPLGEQPLEGAPADDLDARLLSEAEQVPAGSEGLLCLPYLLGERAPWWRSGMRGAYVGLRRDHGRPHLVRAAVEGVCQQLALVRESFDGVGVPVTEVRATGGAVGSALWVTVLAAALGLPVRVAESAEGTGLGACLLGHHALGGFDDLEQAAALVAVREPVEPDRASLDRYRAMRPLVATSTLALTEVFTALDEFVQQPIREDL